MSRTGSDDKRRVLQEAEIKARNDFTLQAMHQQFERLNLQLQKIRDTIADQNDTIVELMRENNVRPQDRRNVSHTSILNQENPIDDFNDIDFDRQGSMSVDEYFKAMDMAMIQANCTEEEEATMARKQTSSWKGRTCTISKKPWPNHEMKSSSRPQEDKGKDKFENKEGGKTFNPKPFTLSSSIQCHKGKGRGHMMHECPSRRNIILREDGGYESEKGEGEEEGDVSDEDDVELPNEGMIKVVKKIMTINLASNSEEQRENIFHTRCGIKGKTCSMIIDSGSCANVVSSYFVEKLGLACMKHHTPYRLLWLNDSGELKVNKQCMISFNVGRYEDDILCDIIPMQACHILLGHPWQYDRNVFHDGRKNRYSLELNGRKFTLAPLSPSSV
uniref:Uncharacterized protein LOC104211962 n=1 Tax=Nicotiana sylvestris TaxID=4096 RepID=A0A1U7VAV2_NICSY|nr:PREDICTED: uncharacterized protein LOC104211962 [Nicotiana sylvestris]